MDAFAELQASIQTLSTSISTANLEDITTEVRRVMFSHWWLTTEQLDFLQFTDLYASCITNVEVC